MEHRHEIIKGVSLAVPAVRTVVVSVSISRTHGEVPEVEWEAYPQIDPVLAIQATAIQVYSRETGSDWSPDAAPTPALLRKAGWEYRSDRVSHEPLLIDGESGGLAPASEAFLCYGPTAWRCVACPWPEAEDQDRLAPVVEQVKAEALEKARREQRERAERRAAYKAREAGRGGSPTPYMDAFLAKASGSPESAS